MPTKQPMPPNRKVAWTTATVAPLVSALVAVGAHYGLDIDGGQLTTLFLAVGALISAPAAQWMHGWQKNEAREAELARDRELAAIAASAAPPTQWIDDSVYIEDDDDFALEDELESVFDDEFDDTAVLDGDDDFDDDVDALDDLDHDLLDDEEPAPAGD